MVWELNQRGVTDIVCVDSVPLSERNLLFKRSYSQFITRDQLWSFLETPGAKKDLTWIVHMGACSSTTETNKEFLWENNTYYTQRIFEWCRDYGKSLIYASSAATYGAGEMGFDDTSDSEKLRPLNLYGESKVLFDRWAMKQTSGPTHWYGLKFFNVFGPNELYKEGQSSVAFKAFHQIKKTNSLGLFKSYNSNYRDGEQKRDFVYVKDITRWMCELMEKKPTNGLYNMGFGKARTWLDLAHAVFKAMNKEAKIQWMEVPANIRDHYQYFTEANMKKWKAAGMSDSQWPLEKAVADYVQNHLNKDSDLDTIL